jgi:hypothetical protein
MVLSFSSALGRNARLSEIPASLALDRATSGRRFRLSRRQQVGDAAAALNWAAVKPAGFVGHA